MSIPKIIRERRKILDLTLKDIANMVGVTEATVQRWESGNIKNLRHDKIQKLAAALQVTPAYLMGWENNPDPTYPLALIPILGKISAGAPLLAMENLEDYAYAPVKNSKDYFYLRVKGDSMINANIRDGYLVLVHKQSFAENGQIVVCRLNGEDATIKRFRKTNDMVILQPENSEYEPILVPMKDFESNYAEIIGVVESVTFTI